MKKVGFLLLIFAFNLSLFGQIKTIPVTQKEEDVLRYDSLKNILKDGIKSYIGQDLYVMPKPENLRKFGYSNFYTDLANKKKYKQCEYSTCYDKLHSKYFHVLDVIVNKEYNWDHDFLLIEKESKDTVYYKFSGITQVNFPFLVVGYYEKLKVTYIGKYFYKKNKNEYDVGGKNEIDTYTGNEILNTNGILWKCSDITVDDEGKLLMLLENEKGTISININWNGLDYDGCRSIIGKSVGDKIKKRSPSIFTSILNEKIKIGMTESDVLLSWGEPDSKNHASYGTQWCYGKSGIQCVYFKNGKVTSWN